MAISDYATLKTTIADYLHRSDLSDAVVSNFVQFAEARMNRKLRLLEQETSGLVSLVAGAQSVALPTGWIETIDVTYDSDKRSIQPQTLKALNSQKTYDTTTGRPYLYATSGGNMVFEITADATYSIAIDYYKKWDIETDDTNWLLTNSPDAYLYGSLLEAKAYIKNIGDMVVWSEGLKIALADLNNLDSRTKRNATVRMDGALVTANRFDINRGF